MTIPIVSYQSKSLIKKTVLIPKAINSILIIGSEKVSNKELMVVDKLNLKTPKTKEMNSILEDMKIADKKLLIVVKELEDNLILASRNLQNVIILASDEINVLDIVATDIMLVDEAALKDIEEVLK